MDRLQVLADMTPEEVNFAAKRRLEAFKFRAPSNIPSSSSLDSMSSRHRRPHSRNGSITSLAHSTSTNSMVSPVTDPSSSSLSSPSDSRPQSISGGRSRPTSHHRRRSSVSTRVESAEIMRINLSDLPASLSDENINLGDKDSIRRRALLALEGKGELGASSSTVQIPDLDSLERSKPKSRSENVTKPQLNVAPGPYTAPSSLSGKRDSFGKLLTPSSSLKDQLHTLVEEEEEEEHDVPSHSHRSREHGKPTIANVQGLQSSGRRIAQTVTASPERPDNSLRPTSPRNKPANLSLRPLALSPSSSSTGLLSPAVSPNIRPLALKALSLSPSDPSLSNSFAQAGSRKNQDSKTTSPPRLGQKPDRHELSGSTSGARFTSGALPSYSYGQFALPTPGATPTSEKRASSSSAETGESDNNLTRDRRSLSDEIFMHQSQVALLARIADLERALRARSFQSQQSQHSEPSDEVLALVTDLKLERDSLKQDLTGYCFRVKELEEGRDRLEQAVAAEKIKVKAKEEKAARLESERSSLMRQLKEKQQELSSLSSKLNSLQDTLKETERTRDESADEARRLQRQLEIAESALQSKKALEEELTRARAALHQEQARREQLERQLSNSSSMGERSAAAGQIPRGLGFQSIDSARTRVGSPDNQQLVKGPFTLKPVEEEEDENDRGYSDEENGLDGYEDEDSDLSFTCQSRSLSSSSLDDEMPRSVQHLQVVAQVMSASPSPSPSPSLCPTPNAYPNNATAVDLSAGSHERKASLSRAWKFPSADQAPTPRRHEVDHFFKCLDELDDSPPQASVSAFTDKNAFSEALRKADAHDSFVLPPIDISTRKGDRSSFLAAVIEEEENMDDDARSIDFRTSIPEPLAFNQARSSFPISVSSDSLSLSSHDHSQECVSSSISSLSPTTPFSSTANGFSSPTIRMELSQSPIAMSPSSSQKSSTPRSNIRPLEFSRPVKPSSPSNRVMTPREPCIPQFASRTSPLFPVKLSTPPTKPRTSPRQTPSPGVTFIAAPSARSPPTPARPAEILKSPPRTYSNGSTLIPQLKSLKTNDPLNRFFASQSEMSAGSPHPNGHGRADQQLVTSVTSPNIKSSFSSHELTNSTNLPKRSSLASLTKLISIPGFSWSSGSEESSGSNAAHETRKKSQERKYVRREVQLAKLRLTMDIERSSQRPRCSTDIACCSECRGSLLSL